MASNLIDELKEIVGQDSSSSSGVPENAYWNSYNRELIRNELRLHCKVRDFSVEVLKLGCRLWHGSTTGAFPSVRDISEHLGRRLCLHAATLSDELRTGLAQNFLVYYGRKPDCAEVEQSILFRQLQGTFPNRDELTAAIERYAEVQMDLAGKAKLDPTPNLSELKSETFHRPDDSKEEFSCAICMDEIEDGQSVYRLMPCGHLFHAGTEQCGGSGGVHKWLSEHSTCPMCRAPVLINAAPECVPPTNWDLINSPDTAQVIFFYSTNASNACKYGSFRAVHKVTGEMITATDVKPYNEKASTDALNYGYVNSDVKTVAVWANGDYTIQRLSVNDLD